MADKPEAFIVRSTLPPFSHMKGGVLLIPRISSRFLLNKTVREMAPRGLLLTLFYVTLHMSRARLPELQVTFTGPAGERRIAVLPFTPW